MRDLNVDALCKIRIVNIVCILGHWLSATEGKYHVDKKILIKMIQLQIKKNIYN